MSIFDAMKSYFGKDSPIEDAPPILTDDAAWGTSRIYAGDTFPEYNPDKLIGRKGYAVYREMMIDEQVKAVTLFRLNSVTGRKYFFRMPKHYDLPQEEIDRRNHIFMMIIKKLPGTFKTKMDGIMSAMHLGASLTEKVHHQIEIDGKTYMGLRSLRTKPIESFEPYFDEFTNLIKLVQRNNSGRDQQLDINNFIHHVNNSNVHAFYGQSELREAYRAYFSKDITIRFHNMWLERMAAGFVWAQPEGQTQLVKGTPEHTALTQALSSIRNHTALIMPRGVKLNIEHPTDTQAFERAIGMQDMSIAKSLLVPNLLGLSEQGKSTALAQSKTQLEAFLWDLDASATFLEETLNEQLFRQLGELNFGDGMYPEFTFRKLSMEQTKDIVEMWRGLTKDNVVVSTEEDENLIRNYLDIPERTVSTEGQEEADAIETTTPDMALNGAQVTSMLGITEAVSAGSLPKETAIQMLITAYPVSLLRAQAIINPITVKEVTNEQGNQGIIREGDKGGSSEDRQVAEGGQSQGSQARGKQGQEGSGGSSRNDSGGGNQTDDNGSGENAGRRFSKQTVQRDVNDHNGGCAGAANDGHHHGGTGANHVSRRVNFAKHSPLRRVQFAAIDRNANVIGVSYTNQMGDAVAQVAHELVQDHVVDFDFSDPDIKVLGRIKANPKSKRELNGLANTMLRESFQLGQDHAKMEVDRATKDKKKLMSHKHNFASIEENAAKYYRARAFTIAGNMSDKVESIVRNAIMNGIQYNKSQQEVSQDIYDRLITEGMIPTDEVPAAYFNEANINITPLYRLENNIRTATFDAINEGRMQFFEDPALEGFVVAYQYSSIIDSGTTEICNELGDADTPFIRLVGDPIWAIYRPLNHFGCRGLLIPLVEGDVFTVSPDDPVNVPQVGFS